MNRLLGSAFWLDFLKITLAILLIIILYRWLLRFLNRKNIDSKKFCELYEVENPVSYGEIPFYFTTEQKRNISLFLRGEDDVEIELCNQAYEPGGHILRFDTVSVANGKYFYILRTENQEITKRIVIEN
ncbi:MAG: hypothetical protein WCG64_06255 [Flavobacteriia bacterium]